MNISALQITRLNPILSLLKGVAIFIFTAGLTGLLGCEDIVTHIDFPDTERKIVVHSFISPADTAMQVMLSWSNPVASGISSENIRIIENAEVGIAEKGQDFNALAFHPEKRTYTLSTSIIRPQAGKHYELRVEVPGHETLTASCYIPEANNSLKIDSLETKELDWGTLISIEYSFTDREGTAENFYAPSAWLNELTYIFEEDTLGMGRKKFNTISGQNYLSNKGREGRKFIVRAESYFLSWGFPEQLPVPDEENSLYLLLLTTDEHYYHYHNDLENYSPNNPFAEPVLIYSNIKGGLGVFAGYNRYELVLPLY